MTGTDLHTTLLAMGCPSSVTDENLYVYLVNASLNKIYNDVVITDTGSIYAHGITPNSVIEEKHHPPGADITIPIVGKAYSMRVCGERAEILVGAGQQTSKLVLTENPTVLKGFTVNGMAVISLLGDYAYSVFDICCYDQLLSVNVADIPDGSYYTSYDVESRYPGFSSFASYPTDKNGKIIECAELSGKTIKVASDYKGEIFFTYRKKPIECLELDSFSPIDIPSQYEMLLPILFMAYYYIDVDESKAECYMETYKDMCKTLQKQESYKYLAPGEEPTPDAPEPAPSVAEYKIINGWA